MRLLFRLAVLALAAVGAKTLYEKLKPTIDSYRGGGDSATTLEETVSTTVSEVTPGS